MEQTVPNTDVMVDIETTGTMPDRHCILQISAVKFNLKEGYVHPEFFDRALMMPTHRCWMESTRNWWADQKREVLMDIWNRAEDWQLVIKDFAEWCYPQNHLRFWSKPTHFDYMFLSSYFHDAGVINPFHYREATDLNSYLRGLYRDKKVPDLGIDFVGDKHNALQDTLHQLRLLFAHYQDATVKPNVTDAVIIEAEHEEINAATTTENKS